MSIPEIFGVAYFDAEKFRQSATLFGVGKALADYPDTDDGNQKLTFVLQAASRMIDTFCSKEFTPGDISEVHELDLETWQFRVNNPPVVSISSCVIRYAIDGVFTVQPDKIFINNQKNYMEITRMIDGSLSLLEAIGTEIAGPQVEITYKSLQSVPSKVQLATAYQAGHLINTGYVDATLPPNFGKIDMDGLSINNKKGYKSADEVKAATYSPEATELLISMRPIAVR